MYRIMICDDEGIVIDSIKFIIEKEFPGQCDIASAKTGRAVIELADSFRPDIAFMDIQMPGINGIEAMKEIRKSNDSVIFIVLTAYDKFDYAKAAINVGVKEYLNKPVDRAKITEVLSLAMKDIDDNRNKRTRELQVKEKLETVVPMIENGLIYNLLFQEYFEEDIENYRNLLGITEKRCFMGAIVFGEERDGNHMTNAVGSSIRLHRCYTEVRELIRSTFNCFVGGISANKIAMLFPTDDETHDYNSRVRLIENARNLTKRIKERTDIDARVGFGHIVDTMDAMSSYRDALWALIQTSGGVAHVDDVFTGTLFDEDYPAQTEKAIADATEKGDEEAQQRAAMVYFDWMVKNYANAVSNIQLKVLELVMRAETIGYIESSDTYHFLSRDDYLPGVISMGQDMDALKGWFLMKLSLAVRRVSESRSNRETNTIERARLYIDENYSKDISLDDVSRVVDISPYYFSRVFKDETGQNFIDYLTERRLDKARELLLSDDRLSMKEISIMVGYSDPNYFSRIFKKNVGVTPTEFKGGKN